ncbi:PA0069 family radical SAM protein [soil metagenome]
MSESVEKKGNYLKGRGAQLQTHNRFLRQEVVAEHIEGLDEPLIGEERTKIFIENPKKIVNKIDSPDLRNMNSANPYQGCEHGCIYCYARNTHNYYGFSAGLDFERNIIVKPTAPALLRKYFENKNYEPESVMFSGNTDCYQPMERRYQITRSMLEVCLEYKNPVGIITKNSLVLRDIDILKKLAADNLVHVMISITSMKDDLRSLLEPRTSTYKNRLHVIEELSNNGIPAGVMIAPVIPGLTSEEIPRIMEAIAERGALTAGYTIVRLNGEVKTIFRDWLYRNLPGAAEKIWNQIRECHGGQVNDSRFGTRMSGEGKIAESIRQLFTMAKKKYLSGRKMPDYDFTKFSRPMKEGDQLNLNLFS